MPGFLTFSLTNNALSIIACSTFFRMKNEHSLQDEMEDLTQDFASCYTAVERETRQETMYREATLHGRTLGQVLSEGEQDLGDENGHFDDRVLDERSPSHGSQRKERQQPIGTSSQNLDAEGGGYESHVPPTEARRNITSRRSHGRSAELSKDPSVLMTKRPRSRPKDVEYRRESVGAQPTRAIGRPLSGHEKLQSNKERIRAEIKCRTDLRIANLKEQSRAARMSEPKQESSSSVPRGVLGVQPNSGSVRHSSPIMPTPVPRQEARKNTFLARNIPARHIAPEIYDELINLMAIRNQYQEDVEEAG